MTPFQMALAAATIANLEGKLMKPKIEYDLPPAVFNQVDHAAARRRDAPHHGARDGRRVGHGARRLRRPSTPPASSRGGKTGTAQKDVPLYDPKTGEIMTVKKQEKDRRGNVIREYEEIVMAPEPRIDSWFLCIAPLESPQIAMAVIIEGGGYGSRSAAPVAAALVLKARELGLLGFAPAPAPRTDKRSRHRRPRRQRAATRRQVASGADLTRRREGAKNVR